jgi:hypothetical protein
MFRHLLQAYGRYVCCTKISQIKDGAFIQEKKGGGGAEASIYFYGILFSFSNAV